MTLRWVVSLMAVAVIAWTLLPLLRHEAWWVRVFEFPRVQITVLGVATLLAYAAVAGWRDPQDQLLLAALAGCIVFQLARVVRYTRPYPLQVQDAPLPVTPRDGQRTDDDTLSLLVANVLMSNRNAPALLRLVRERRPDVVLTLETDHWWQDQLQPLQADYPHTVRQPQDNLYGMHLYSRLPLVDAQVHFLVEDDVPSIHTGVRLRNGRLVQLHGLHPAPPTPTENPTSAERDAELLLVAKSLVQPPRAVVVMGDLNDVAWSATTRLFQNISGLLDPRIGRGMFSTFHARYPFLRWPLDHVFCSPDFRVVSLARLPDIGSDHFPIEAVLCLAPQAVAGHETPEANDEARQIAERKIEKVDGDENALR